MINLEQLLLKLKCVRRSGRGWIARCPSHDDRSPSLSITEARDGKLLLHCFAGCSVEAICQAIRINLSDLFADSKTARQPEPEIVRAANQKISALRSWLAPGERDREITVVATEEENIDQAIARGLALAVEGELVQLLLLRRGR